MSSDDYNQTGEDGDWAKWRIFVLNEIRRLSDSLVALAQKLDELADKSSSDSEARGTNIALMNQSIVDLRERHDQDVTDLRRILNDPPEGILPRMKVIESDNISASAIKKYKRYIFGVVLLFLVAAFTPVVELLISVIFHK